MDIFDAHVHARNTKIEPERLLGEMALAGVKGSCVFSTRPIEEYPNEGTDYETRLNEILAWTNGRKDRLFPVLWVTPNEEGVDEKIENAVKKGSITTY